MNRALLAFCIFMLSTTTCADTLLSKHAQRLIQEVEQGERFLENDLVADDYEGSLDGLPEKTRGKENFETFQNSFLSQFEHRSVSVANVVESGNMLSFERDYHVKLKTCNEFASLVFLDRIEFNEKGQIRKWEGYNYGGIGHAQEYVQCKGRFTDIELLRLTEDAGKWQTFAEVEQNASDNFSAWMAETGTQKRTAMCKGKQDCKSKVWEPLKNIRFRIQLHQITPTTEKNTVVYNRKMEVYTESGCIYHENGMYKVKFEFPSGKMETFEMLTANDNRKNCLTESFSWE